MKNYYLALIALALLMPLRLAAQSDFPHTAPEALPFTTICQGGTVDFYAKAIDDGRQSLKYKVALYKPGGVFDSYLAYDVGSYTGTVTFGTAGIYLFTNRIRVQFTMPRDLTAGSGYYMVLFSQTAAKTYLDGPSTAFSIKPLTTLTISGTPTLVAGSLTNIFVALTGTPPYSFDYNDYSQEYASVGYVRTLSNVNLSFGTITLRMPFATPIAYNNTYVRNLKDASGCPGPNTISGAATVTSTPLPFFTQLDLATVCSGQAMSIRWGPNFANAQLRPDFIPVAQLSDASGNFSNPTEIARGAAGYYTGTSNTLTATIPASAAAGNGYKIRVVSSRADYNALITPSVQAVTITKPDKPTVANTNPAVCQGDASVTLSATGSNLKWYDAANNLQSGAPTQGTGNPGSYGYSVKQVVGSCESEAVGITVKVKTKPGAPGVAAKEICQNGPSYTVEASGSNLRWFNTSDGLWNGNGATPVVSTGNAGPQTFKVDQQVDGCYSDKATMTVTVNAPPAAPAVTTPTAVCQYIDVPNLTANGQNLKWYTAETGGNGQNTVKPSSDQAGTTPYWVSQTDKGCEGARAKVEQTISAASPAPTTATVLLCKDQQATPLTATGTSLKWYNSANGLIGTTAPTPTTNQLGDVTYRVSQTTNGCESKKVDLIVSVKNTPGAPSVVAVALCQNQVAKPLTATGDGLSWYDVETGGTSQTALTPQTATLGDKAYWVSQRFGTCEGPRAKLTTTVNAVPVAPVATGKDFCINDPTTPLAATGEALRWYTTADRSTPAQASVTPTTDKSQNLTYYVSQTKNGCESATTAVAVRVRAKAVATLTGEDKVFAYDSTAIRIKLDGDGPWSLTLWSGQAVTTSTTPYVKWVTPTNAGATATYKLLAIRNDCGSGDVGNTYTLTVLTPLATETAPSPTLYLLPYPSPATAQCTLAWQAPTGSSVTLRLLTLTGSVGWQAQRTGTGRQQTEVVDLSEFAAGVILVELQTTDNQRKASSLIKY